MNAFDDFIAGVSDLIDRSVGLKISCAAWKSLDTWKMLCGKILTLEGKFQSRVEYNVDKGNFKAFSVTVEIKYFNDITEQVKNGKLLVPGFKEFQDIIVTFIPSSGQTIHWYSSEFIDIPNYFNQYKWPYYLPFGAFSHYAGIVMLRRA